MALRAAKLNMPDHGLAEKMLEHFVSGDETPVRVDLNVELARNPQLREYVASRIEFELAKRAASGATATEATGAIWVPQGAYGDTKAGEDQRLALGGTYFEYQVMGSAHDGGLEVTLSVSDHYFWSPSDTTRATQCLHECGSSLVSSQRATEFHQIGHGTIVVADPWREPAMTPLDVEAPDRV